MRKLDYRLHGGLFGPLRGTFLALVTLTLPYARVTLRGRRKASLSWGAVASVAGVVGLGMLAYQVSLPTWGFAGVFISLLAGSLALGLVSESMIMGHWYLVRPNKSIHEVATRSVRKKLKDKAFARSVNRADIIARRS